MIHSFVFLMPEALDLSAVGAGYARTAFILRLPFRVRTGMLFSLPVDSSFEVVFRNILDIPQTVTSDDVLKLIWVGTKLRPTEEFFTEVMIIDRNPPVDEATAKRFAECLQQADGEGMPSYNKRLFRAVEALNDAIVAYHSATQSLFGGYVVERLTYREFIERVRYVHTILSPPNYVFTDQDIHEIFNARPDRDFVQIGGQMATELADYSPEKISSIQEYLKSHRRFLFYQFALDAKSKMVEMDYFSAIIFAAVALEGAHAALLQMCLDRIMGGTASNPDERAKQIELKANKLLIDVGFAEMVEITSMMFLEEADRPNPGDVEACKLGITIRNEIMHALAKKGQYKLRNRTNDQISNAYSNMLKLYQHFVRIIERTTSDAQIKD
jgi:hypothetical protein